MKLYKIYDNVSLQNVVLVSLIYSIYSESICLNIKFSKLINLSVDNNLNAVIASIVG